MTETVRNISEKLNLEAALWYAEQGWHVFPLYEISRGQCSCAAGSRCGAPGKHPRSAKGFKDATTDPAVIQRWFRQWPAAGIGIATGLSGIVVLDIDPRNQGDKTLAQLLAEHGALPHTPRILTGGGGEHFYFRKPAGDFDSFVLAQGIDVKSDGGYVVAAPTMHIMGVQYRADPDAHPARTELAELPEWIQAKKKESKKKRKSSAKVTEGFLGAAMEHAGWLGKAMGLDRTAVQCPWESEHTSGVTRDGSSVVFAPVEGSRTGWVTCLHSHCKNRTQLEWIDALPEEAKQAARERLGMDENYTPRATTAAAPRDINWKQSLCFDQHGNMSKEPGNIEIILKNDPLWEGCLGYDEFKNVKVWLKPPPAIVGMTMPAVGPVLDKDAVYIQQFFKKNNNVSFGPDAVRAGLEKACDANLIHPVKDYLKSLSWDGQPRLCRLYATYFGADDNDYTRLISPWWMTSAVARVFDPGCKVDSVLILEGAQGAGKSTAVSILADPWFCDTPINIGDVNAYLTMRGRWIIELAELESLNRAEASKAKAFFTSPIDTYRAPYGRDILEIPRQCVFVGTVNHGEYLRDETGGRRFQPVKCETIHIELLRKHKDQLWAEAVTMYQCGEVWWPKTDGEAKLCGTQQSERFVEDVWEGEIKTHCTGMTETSVRDILDKCFGLLSKDWTRAQEMRVASCLKRLKFKKSKSAGVSVWTRAPRDTLDT